MGVRVCDGVDKCICWVFMINYLFPNSKLAWSPPTVFVYNDGVGVFLLGFYFAV